MFFNTHAMLTYRIRTYRDGIETIRPSFFILSRGNNTGKPLKEPCPNCFIIETSNKHDQELLYWLTYSLWQAKIFYPELIGSVIPFIRIRQVKEILNNGLEAVGKKHQQYQDRLQVIQKIEKQLVTIQKQTELLTLAKQAILRKALI